MRVPLLHTFHHLDQTRKANFTWLFRGSQVPSCLYSSSVHCGEIWWNHLPNHLQRVQASSKPREAFQPPPSIFFSANSSMAWRHVRSFPATLPPWSCSAAACRAAPPAPVAAAAASRAQRFGAALGRGAAVQAPGTGGGPKAKKPPGFVADHGMGRLS